MLRLEDAERPEPGEGQVLVRIRASSVDPYDRHFLTGMPKPLRLSF